MGTTGQSITLANSIIGVGILAMPFCFQQCGVLLATLILLSMGLVSRLCCYFLLKAALLARRRNFEFLAFHVFGSAGKMAVELGIIGFLMGTCIAYFVVVGDLGPQIIAKMFNINQSDILRTSIMVIVSLVCVLPLGLLRNVDSLSNVSAATIGFYFCLVIKVISEAATQLFTAELGARMELWKPQGVLQCVPIFSMALFCQTQLFEIFESLPTLSLEKMNVVTKNAINICTAVYFTLGLFGYIAFSKHEISGNILMSLSPTMTSDVIKLGFVMSLAFSFPLIIFPCRASLYSFLYRKVHPSQHDHIINHSIPEGTFRCITVAIIAMALFVSLLIPNIELVLGLVGSTIGVLICVVFPAACFVNVTFKNTNERVLAKVILVLGLVIMVLGTYANLQAAENTHDKYDDKYITQEKIDKIVEDFFQSKKLENEGVVVKPPQTIEPVVKEEIKNIKEVVVDSEVQPPNPVPPESQPVENNNPPPPNPDTAKEIENKKKEIDDKKKEIAKEIDDTKKEIAKEINEKKKEIAQVIADKKKLKESPEIDNQEIDKVSETHPKNLNKITDAKLSNGETKNDEKAILTKDDVKQMSNQQKIDYIKQAQFIETIKQHGEEQKELLKEQKEILDNIMKTKQELQQNNNEAKKIAVESIQKIANMAIQSLNAVSEQPVDPIENIMQPVDNTNDAVKKIADVAVEAIKEIKEKPLVIAPVVHKENILANENDGPKPAQSNNQVKRSEPIVVPAQNGNKEVTQNSIDVPVKPTLVKQNQNVQQQNSVNEVIPNEPIAQNPYVPVPNVNNIIAPKSVDVNPQEIKIDQVNNVQPVANIAPANKPIENLVSSNIVDKLIAETSQNNAVPQKPVERSNDHSHSPDEPQSYKQGEDAQKILDTKENILNNVPLPIAMNGNGIKSAEKKLEVVKSPEIHVQNQNGAKEDSVKTNDNLLGRQKREVVDCGDKVSLKAEDKEICKNLLNSKDSQEILPKVDLNDALNNGVPVVNMDMVHHMRSLKSYNEEKER
ncbi:uncharacterized protein [Choristoneura fumiferana]|uniref:uncharacterized protein n=1 Tax=Choristoneura fumiferana TaxID=7141 RepID=UPI003D15CE97